MKPPGFVHLHVHSHYSLLDGACKIGPLVETIRNHRMSAAALTDHGSLFGAIDFYQACLKVGIKPIVGIEAYVAPNKLTDRKDVKGIRESSYHLTLLAANERGYKNLLKLSTQSYREGFYYKPRIDKEALARHSEGLIALSGCPNSEFGHACRTDQIDKAVETAALYRDILGPENFYLEIQSHGLADEKKIIAGASVAAKKMNLKIVATNDVHYVRKEDYRAHDVLLCISTHKLLTDTDRLNYKTPEFYIKSPQEMFQLFGDMPEALTNTLEVADRCNLEILTREETHLPRFDPPPGKSQNEYLRELCESGVRRRYNEVTPAIRERLEYELRVIENIGFISYFLIVWDFIRFAKENDIPVGPGRGSAAGSIVAYVLGITDIDPLKYDLLFERFLNPSRKEMPDIDIDFCRDGRQRVIDYVKQKYGSDNVSQIITFGKMKAKQAIRDVGRVLNIDLATVNRIAKRIPMGPDVNLTQVLKDDAEFAAEFTKDERLADLKEFALRLEGNYRQASMHAAGVVISDKPLIEYVPLFVSDGGETTQYTMEILQKLGLLKMDFLGLETLTVIDKAVRLIAETRRVAVDIDRIPLDDPATFALLTRGAVRGVFQLETSRGMRDLVQKMKPDRFEDIIATIALFRPGPIQGGMIEKYIKCKHGEEKPDYMHPQLEPLLKETNGVLLYQEQVMRIANRLAGLSMTDADAIRKAMGKKNRELIAKFREPFVKGCRKNGINEELASAVYDVMEYFGGYGFNKSHSAAYAMITYRTAWLKANYPAEYMAALLSCSMSSTEKIAGYIEECRQIGIDVLPPDINESQCDFTPIVGGATPKIRFGLGAIKNIGEKAVESILRARERLGKLRNLYEFCENVDTRAVDKKVIEILIRSGAFSAFGCARSQMLAALADAMSLGGARQQSKKSGQLSIFGSDAGAVADYPPLPEIPEMNEEQILAGEKESLGFYVTSNPIVRHEEIIKTYATTTVDAINEMEDGAEVILGGMISSVRFLVTKTGQNKGSRYASLNFSDLTGTTEAVIFASDLEKFREFVREDLVGFIAGRVSFRNEKAGLRVSAVIPVEKAREQLTASVRISLRASGLEDAVVEKLKGVLETHPGQSPVLIDVVTPENQRILIRTGSTLMVTPSDRFLQDVEILLGQGAVAFTPRRGLPSPQGNNNGGRKWERRG